MGELEELPNVAGCPTADSSFSQDRRAPGKLVTFIHWYCGHPRLFFSYVPLEIATLPPRVLISSGNVATA